VSCQQHNHCFFIVLQIPQG